MIDRPTATIAEVTDVEFYGQRARMMKASLILRWKFVPPRIANKVSPTECCSAPILYFVQAQHDKKNASLLDFVCASHKRSSQSVEEVQPACLFAW